MTPGTLYLALPATRRAAQLEARRAMRWAILRAIVGGWLAVVYLLAIIYGLPVVAVAIFGPAVLGY